MEREKLPYIIRQQTELTGYPSIHRDLFKGFIQQRLAEGVSKLGASPKYDEIVEGYEKRGVFREWDKKYEEYPLDETIQVIRERECISQKPYIAFDNGSFPILDKITELFYSSKKSESKINPSKNNNHRLVIGIGHAFFGMEYFVRMRETEYGPEYISTIKEAEGEMQLNILDKKMDDWLLEEVEKERTEKEIAYYVCDPATPTGDSISDGIGKNFLEYAHKKNRLVVLDQVFLANRSKSWIKYVDSYSNLVVVDSTSKVDGIPGVRGGYIVMPESIGEEYKKREIYYPIPNGSRIKLSIALSKDVFDPWNKYVSETTAKEKRALMHSLASYGINYLPTDDKSFIITIDGVNESFTHYLTESFGVDVVSGFGFAGLTGRYARAVIPIGKLDRRIFVKRVRNAIEAGNRPTRPLAPESTYEPS